MSDFLFLLPEVILALTLAAVIVAEITYHGERFRLVAATALIGLGGALVQTVLGYQYGVQQVFGGALSMDGFSLFFRLFFIVLAILAVVFSTQSREIPVQRRSEYCALLLSSAMAMSLMAAASDLLLAFLSMQFVNILNYFLAGYGKDSERSAEAAVKYMIFWTVGSAFFLYGLSLIFANAHTLNIYEIHRVFAASLMPRDTMLVAFSLLLFSFCFQWAAFPMYLWAPDVLQGAPTASSSFITVGVRAAGFALATRFFLVMFAQPGDTPGHWQILGNIPWQEVVAIVSGLTISVGSFLALRQKSAKRMVACLAVTQSGQLMVGLLVLDQVGVAGVLFNLVVELFAIVGAYYVISYLAERVGSDVFETVRDRLIGFIPECICLILFLLCMVGLPPTPGFIGKFTLIGVAIRYGWTALGVIATAGVALSTAAIARLSFQVIGGISEGLRNAETKARKEVQEGVLEDRRIHKIFLVILLLPLGWISIFADTVLRWAGESLNFIFW